MENDELDNILTDENKRKELKEYCLNILNKIECLVYNKIPRSCNINSQ